jgi:serine/threonine protein kinase
MWRGYDHKVRPGTLRVTATCSSACAQADIWSVGVLSFQLLTGQLPYDVDEERCTDPEYWAEVARNIDTQYAEHTEHLNAETIDGIQQLLQARASWHLPLHAATGLAAPPTASSGAQSAVGSA